jgi:17beta-estradiol 17-dehydrogenase / very-long-chain 3-oxoacyl-CoA reductase
MESSTFFHFVYILGALKMTAAAYRLLAFINMYISPSTLDRYLTRGAYALVTFASEGLGRDLVMELAKSGFNLVLHGRDELMLSLTKIDVLNLNPSLNVITMLQGQGKTSDLDISMIDTVPITVLVNNIGDLQANQQPDGLSRMRLAKSLSACLSKPALLLNVVSCNMHYAIPYQALLAGSEIYYDLFCKSLSTEPDQIETISMFTGRFISKPGEKPVGILTPGSEIYAKSVLSGIGCGKKCLIPYWPHAIQSYLFSILPAALLDDLIRGSENNKVKSSL